MFIYWKGIQGHESSYFLRHSVRKRARAVTEYVDLRLANMTVTAADYAKLKKEEKKKESQSRPRSDCKIVICKLRLLLTKSVLFVINHESYRQRQQPGFLLECVSWRGSPHFTIILSGFSAEGSKLQHQGIPPDWDRCLRSGTPLLDPAEKHTTASGFLKLRRRWGERLERNDFS